MNIKKIETYLFYFFLFIIPFQKRHVFFNDQSFIRNGIFNEWTSVFLYASDIVLVSVFLLWIIRIFLKRKDIIIPKIKKIKCLNWKQYIFQTQGLIVLFVLVSFLSVYLSNYKEYIVPGIYRSVKLIEFFVLFIYISKRISSIIFQKMFICMMIISGLFQSLISVVQYYKQHSLGLKIFGEIDLNSDITNIGKVSLSSDVSRETIIRSVGTFPHSNILAGFLMICILFCMYFLITKLSERKKDKVQLFLISGIMIILFTGFIPTFSRTAYIGLFIGMLSLIIYSICKKMITLSLILSILPQLGFMIIGIIVLMVLYQAPLRARLFGSNEFDRYSTQGRVLYTSHALDVIKNNVLFGIGTGNFTPELEYVSRETYDKWQIQPVHNMYLLITAENGMLGIILFMSIIISLIQVINKKIHTDIKGYLYVFSIILFSILFVSVFDHYFYTIQQGQILFWIVLGSIYGIGKMNNVSRETITT